MTDDELIEPTGDFNELAAFLDSEDAPAEWMWASVLDGFLAGIVVSPTRIRPGEWMPMIWGDAPFESEEQGQWVLAAVMARFNEINQFVRLEREQPPAFHFDRGPDGEPSMRGWAIGFLKALSLREDAWVPLLEDKNGRQLVAPLFSYMTNANGDPVVTVDDVPADELDSYLVTVMPDLIRGIYAFWELREPSEQMEPPAPPRRRKVGRNEPCPCGSGRKAKRCCGAG
ncbi:hypothetical protein CKO28_23400 [Rhodovibrio sodomensis]|uniref:YecA family protein n=1 Tax=Rhodovibrio sodomensis TaxID=1088 RepID=A0ABS1DLR5_9PROT|nr:YecA family protein [Rhodovibrio sodomensis]MBK1670961.1 hypothetical protein [Rhodovibrio sodomensis]